MESIERDPQGAVELYQQILDEKEASPARKAKAQLRMGICFEKLGKPDYAERVYRQIINPAGNVPMEIVQQAQANLRRLEAEKRSASAQEHWVNRFYPSRFSLLVGPSFLASNNGTPTTRLATGLRFRISAADRPLAWFLEASGTTPLAHSNVANQTQGIDNASLSFRYQTSLGLVGELPHGHQRRVLPEAGAGLALTAAKISYTSAASSGDLARRIWSPYVQAGLRVFPDHIVSVLFQARYVPAPYPKSVDIPAPAHSQTFNFPSSQWSIGVTLQIKIGRFVREPQR